MPPSPSWIFFFLIDQHKYVLRTVQMNGLQITFKFICKRYGVLFYSDPFLYNTIA